MTSVSMYVAVLTLVPLLSVVPLNAMAATFGCTDGLQWCPLPSSSSSMTSSDSSCVYGYAALRNNSAFNSSGIYPSGAGSVEVVTRIIDAPNNVLRSHIIWSTGMDYQVRLMAQWDDMSLLFMLMGHINDENPLGGLAAAVATFEFDVWYHIVCVWLTNELVLYINGVLTATTPFTEIDAQLWLTPGGFELGGIWTPTYLSASTGPSDVDIAAVRIWPYDGLTTTQVVSLAAGEPLSSLDNLTSVGWRVYNGRWQPWTISNSNNVSTILQSQSTLTALTAPSAFTNKSSTSCSDSDDDNDHQGWKYGVGLGVGFGGMLCLVGIGYRAARRHHRARQNIGNDAVAPVTDNPNFHGFFNLPRQQPRIASPPLAVPLSASIISAADDVRPVAPVLPAVSMLMVQPHHNSVADAPVAPVAPVSPVAPVVNGISPVSPAVAPVAPIPVHVAASSPFNAVNGAVVIVNARAEGQPPVVSPAGGAPLAAVYIPSHYIQYGVPMGPPHGDDDNGAAGAAVELAGNHNDNHIVRVHHNYGDDVPDAEPFG